MSKPYVGGGYMHGVVISSCKSFLILKECSRCIHYIRQEKSSSKSKLTNYVKQIPLDT